MPSISAPTWYERADYVMSSRTDEFFKRLDLDEAVEYTGSTEEPVGFVMLVQVTRQMIREYVSTAGDPWMSERRNFDAGWYITRQDDNGLIWAMSYGGACDEHDGDFCADTHAEEQARADYNEANQVSLAWHDAEYEADRDI